MKLMYVYMLRCKDGTYYTGVTNSVDRRLKEHELGVDVKAYTFNRRPVVVYHQIFDSPLAAIEFEKRLKKWSRKKKEALINGDFEGLPDLSKKAFDR
ncbi:MAG: GIY-YIG nuclease family protein [Flavobacteriales bacterium]|nr:GIY-YIG nuclease family protein [Flavobacteriales bacterium]MCB9191849.1 GIY-YIG nuclease family protein [Flavobacteriales bacterium]MCB9204730.1 GIY-YIG nuclease family protein [Flavobacteriales bacterium]